MFKAPEFEGAILLFAAMVAQIKIVRFFCDAGAHFVLGDNASHFGAGNLLIFRSVYANVVIRWAFAACERAGADKEGVEVRRCRVFVSSDLLYKADRWRNVVALPSLSV